MSQNLNKAQVQNEGSATLDGNEAVLDSAPAKSSSHGLGIAVPIILGMLAAFPPICTDIYLPSLPRIMMEMSTDAATIQLSLTACFFGMAIGQMVVGPLADSYGRKAPLYGSLIVFAISSVACALSQDVFHLIIARLFQGLAGAGGIVLSRTMACDKFEGKDLIKFMALLMTINGIAPILGPMIGSAIISFMDWQGVFIFLTIWALILIFLVFIKLPETLPPEKRNPQLGKSILDMLKQLVNARFLFMTLSMSFIFGGFLGYISASSFVYQNVFSLSPVQFSIAFAINAIVIGIAANGAAKMVHKFRESTVVYAAIIFQLLVVLAMGAMVLTDTVSLIPFGICLALYAAMMGASQAAGFGIVMESRSGGIGAASAIFGVMTFLFGAFCAPLVGLQGENTVVPLVITMLVCSVLCIICFFIGLLIKKPFREVELNSEAIQDAKE